MKTTHALAVLACLFFANPTEAQFLKKLKKKAEQAVERTILNRTDKEVSKKTDEGIDVITGKGTKKPKNENESAEDVFEMDNESMNTGEKTEEEINEEKAKGLLGKLFKGMEAGQETETNNPMATGGFGEPVPSPADNNVQLPDSYVFSYQAKLQITNNQGSKETDYYLQPNETYYAQKQANPDFQEYKVYDLERNTEVYFAEMKGQKMMAHQKMDIFTMAKMVGAYKDASNKEIKSIGEKKLLGFSCKGYKIKTDEGITQLWVTNEAPATLYVAMFKKRAETPDSPFTKNTMIMEVNFISNETAVQNYQMLCTQLQPKGMVFSLSDYKK